jgi:hypothetical protein
VIELTFNNSDQRLLSTLKDKHQSLLTNLTRQMDILLLKMLQRVQQKMSGEVLNQRSGALKDSAHAVPAAMEGDSLTGGVQWGAGPASAYAFVQEYGGKGYYDIYPVNKKALAFFPSGAAGFATLSSGRQVNARQILNSMRNPNMRTRGVAQFSAAGGIVVKSVHHPPLPARPIGQPTLDEMKGEIVTGLQGAVDETLRK